MPINCGETWRRALSVKVLIREPEDREHSAKEEEVCQASVSLRSQWLCVDNTLETLNTETQRTLRHRALLNCSEVKLFHSLVWRKNWMKRFTVSL